MDYRGTEIDLQNGRFLLSLCTNIIEYLTSFYFDRDEDVELIDMFNEENVVDEYGLFFHPFEMEDVECSEEDESSATHDEDETAEEEVM